MKEQSTHEQDAPEADRGKKHTLFHHRKPLFFGIVALVFVAIFCIVNMPSVSALLTKIADLFSPVIIGCVIAYLCNPILEFYEYRVLRRMSKTGIRRGLSLLLAILTMLGIFSLLLLASCDGHSRAFGKY